jgi:hypothetical protein
VTNPPRAATPLRLENAMPAQIVQTEIPGLFNVWIPSTGEQLNDLTTGQVTQLIAERNLTPLH